MNPPAHASRPRILVIGDVMLDHHRIGEATRISPEAPVPIVLNPQEEFRPGGAGAVAAMCAALGAETVLISVTGNDQPADQLQTLLTAAHAGPFLVRDPARPTTLKQRICAIASGRHRQQLARLDTESTAPLSHDLSLKIARLITGLAPHTDAIIISDYAKGVCTRLICQAAIGTAIPVFVDPPKVAGELRDPKAAPEAWKKYHGATCLTPNREEAGPMLAQDIRRTLALQAAVVKLDREGCRLDAESIQWEGIIPAETRNVVDVTGAGDQFLAALTLARVAGLDWYQAACRANIAAGLQVERQGCHPVTRAELDHATRTLAATTSGSSSPTPD